MPIRTSKTEHEYPYGRHRQVGEKFNVDENDVQVLLLLGRIEPEAGEAGFVDPAAATATTYRTREMTAARGRRANNRGAP